MATNTPKLNLVKPAGGENALISQINANMDIIDDNLNTKTCTSTTRPSSPFQGQLIFETDTNGVAVYSGTNWLYVRQDTGWLENTAVFESMAANWSIGTIKGKVKNGFVEIRGDLIRTSDMSPTSSFEDVGTLAPIFRPAVSTNPSTHQYHLMGGEGNSGWQVAMNPEGLVRTRASYNLGTAVDRLYLSGVLYSVEV